MRVFEDYPRPGISFKDISTLIKDPVAFDIIINALAEKLKDFEFDSFLGLESRGFIFGTALAIKMKKAFVMLRKGNKLPGECYTT